MATSWTLAVILILSLGLGWRHHFRVLQHRQMITKIALQAEKARMTVSQQPVNTRVVAPPGSIIPGTSSTLLGDGAPLRYNPHARETPKTTVVELLPMANASSVLAEAEQIVRKYMDTPLWQDRLKYVFEPERVRKLMEDYYDHQHNVDPVTGALMSQTRTRMNNIEVVVLTYRGARLNGRLEVALRRTSADRLVIDWESLVGYSEKSFSKLIVDRPDQPVLVRGFVSVHDYYYEFADDKKHLSIKVTSPDGGEFFNAYCQRGSRMEDWIYANVGGRPEDHEPRPLTLWISYPPQAQSGRCANLVQIQAGSWLIVPDK
jgi:hypothetical protein